jgi:hypothetical protein
MSEIISRFMNKVEKTETCWIWKAQIQPTGYGTFWMNKKNQLSHRVSWVLFKGDIPNGLWVLHRCDNPSCVNPDHLFLGTPKDNTHDMMNKGRERKQISKLTERDLANVLDLYKNGVSQREISRIFNTTQFLIWRHIHKKVPVKKCIGEGNKKSVLTEMQVKEIRSSYIPIKVSFNILSKKYNVNKSTIERIIRRETWQHI